MNAPAFLQNLTMHVLENLRHLPGSPSVAMQELPPRDFIMAMVKERASKHSSRTMEQQDDLRDDEERD
jgi:histone deacetylase 1/2